MVSVSNFTRTLQESLEAATKSSSLFSCLSSSTWSTGHGISSISSHFGCLGIDISNFFSFVFVYFFLWFTQRFIGWKGSDYWHVRVLHSIPMKTCWLLPLGSFAVITVLVYCNAISLNKVLAMKGWPVFTKQHLYPEPSYLPLSQWNHWILSPSKPGPKSSRVVSKWGPKFEMGRAVWKTNAPARWKQQSLPRWGSEGWQRLPLLWHDNLCRKCAP